MFLKITGRQDTRPSVKKDTKQLRNFPLLQIKHQLRRATVVGGTHTALVNHYQIAKSDPVIL